MHVIRDGVLAKTLPSPVPAWTPGGETRGFLHAHLFRCGWRASYSLVEVYRLACIGIDQANRLRRAGGGSVAYQLVRVNPRLDRAVE